MQPGLPALPFRDFKDDPRAIDRGEHAGQDAKRQGDSESANLIGPDRIEDHGGDNRGEVGVDDGDEGAVEAVADRHSQCGSLGLLFTHPFEDQHVGVHRHTDGQHEAGKSGEGERRFEQDHEGDRHADVEHEHDGGDDTGEVVVHQHEHEDRAERDRKCPGAFHNHVGAEQRTDLILADRFFIQSGWQTACPKNADQEVDFLLRELTGDLAVVGNPTADRGSGKQGAVEHDAKLSDERFVRQVLSSQGAHSPSGFSGARAEIDLWIEILETGGNGAEVFALNILTVVLEHQDIDLLDALTREVGHELGRTVVERTQQRLVVPRDDFTCAGIANQIPPHADLVQLLPAFGRQFVSGDSGPESNRLSGRVLDRRQPPLQGIGSLRSREFEQGGVVPPVRHDAELQHAGGADRFLDPFDFERIDVRNDDFDLAFAERPDHDFLRAARIDTPRQGDDEAWHVEARTGRRGVRVGIGRVVARLPGARLAPARLSGRAALDIDFIDQDNAALQVDPQFRRPAEGENSGRREQHADDDADTAADLFHPQRFGDPASEYERKHEHAKQHRDDGHKHHEGGHLLIRDVRCPQTGRR